MCGGTAARAQIEVGGDGNVGGALRGQCQSAGHSAIVEFLAPQVGGIEAGLVGGLVSVPFAIVSGGLACVAAAGVFAVKVKSFSGYTATKVRTE